MSFIKKYPLLSAVYLVALLIFISTIVLFFIASSKYSTVEGKFKQLERQRQSLVNAYPSPVKDNLEAVTDNAKTLSETLYRKKNSLVSREDLIVEQPNISGIGVLGRIQGMILDFENKVDYTDVDGNAKTIKLADDEAFGFALYGGADTITPPDEYAPELNHQVDVLRYLLTQLFESQPLEIVSVERERVVPVAGEENTGNRFRREESKIAKDDIFSVSPGVTVAVEGSIDTTGYKLVFNGYTNSLRSFLTKVAEFDIPVVIREISVKPAKIDQAAAKK